MAESVTVGELLIRIRADVNALDRGLRQSEGLVRGFEGRSRPSLARLENAFRGLGISAVGLPGPLGRVANILLSFGPGGLAMSAALAGLGVLALAWKAISDRAKEAREEMEKNLATVRALATTRHERIQGLLKGVFGGPDLRTQLEAEIVLQTALLKRMEPLWESLGIVVSERGKEMLATIQSLSDAWGELVVSMIPVESLFSERWQKLRESLKDLKPAVLGKSLGEVILPRAFKDIPFRDIGSIIASDENVQRIVRAFERQRAVFVEIGQSIGDALAQGINAVLSGGNFFKSFFRTLLDIGIRLAATAIGTAIGGPVGGATAGTAAGGVTGWPGMRRGPPISGAVAPTANTWHRMVIDFSNMPVAQTPMAAARDGQWQRFIRESVLVAQSQGAR